MRNKKNKLLAFSVLALCVACLAFGVYALKNATLTINGTVGFTAHDCLVYVVAEIEGDGVAVDANGTVTPNNHGEPSEKRDLIINKDENSNEMLVGGASESEWEKVAPVGAIYFTDLTDSGEVAQIKMTFTLTNQSAYSVTASISNEQFDLANIVVGASEEITLEKGATGTLTATFDLNANDNGEYPEVNNLPFEVKLDFRKATTGGNQGGGEETETPEYLTGIPQTIPEIIAMFDETPYTATEQPHDDTMPTGAIGGVASTNDKEVYGYIVFDTVDNASAYFAENKNGLYSIFGENNVVWDRLVVATYTADSSNLGGGEEVILAQLPTPTNAEITYNDIGNLTCLAFDKVENAESYQVEVLSETTGNKQTFAVTNTYVDLSQYVTLPSGTYSIYVRALGDGINYGDSEQVLAGSYTHTQRTTLETPKNSKIVGDYLYVGPVENATGYEVLFQTPDGMGYTTYVYQNDETGSYELNLENYFENKAAMGEYVYEGEYSVSIKALGDSSNYLDSEYYTVGEYNYPNRVPLAQPTGSISGDILTVGTVANASGYSARFSKGAYQYIATVEMDGEGNYTLNLATFLQDKANSGISVGGDWTISVFANGDNVTYSNSEENQVGTYKFIAEYPTPRIYMFESPREFYVYDINTYSVVPQQIQIEFHQNGECVLTLVKNLSDFTVTGDSYRIDLTTDTESILGETVLKAKFLGDSNGLESQYYTVDRNFK